MELKLSGSHQSTYDAVFQHPVARNLKWVDVRELLVALADSFDERGDLLKLQRNGKSLALHRPARSGMGDIAELMKVRHFLQDSAAEATAQPLASGDHVLVVIDHRCARIYQSDLHGTVPQRIVPDDSSGSGKHLHYVEDDATGQHKPEQASFYQAVAKVLQGAQRILIFGSGTGTSSAMQHLVAELGSHHKELSDRVVASVVVDESHLTDDQLLAKARELFVVA